MRPIARQHWISIHVEITKPFSTEQAAEKAKQTLEETIKEALKKVRYPTDTETSMHVVDR